MVENCNSERAERGVINMCIGIFCVFVGLYRDAVCVYVYGFVDLLSYTGGIKIRNDSTSNDTALILT